MTSPSHGTRLTSYVWEPIATNERKAYARQLIDDVHTGLKHRQAVAWLKYAKYGGTKLDNFIKNMEAAKAAKAAKDAEEKA